MACFMYILYMAINDNLLQKHVRHDLDFHSSSFSASAKSFLLFGNPFAENLASNLLHFVFLYDMFHSYSRRDVLRVLWGQNHSCSSTFFIQCCIISISLSLSSSGGGISVWIGALQVINQKASQPTTLGFGHVGSFFLSSNYWVTFCNKYMYQQGSGCLYLN